MKFLGYSAAHNRWGDPTGYVHIQVEINEDGVSIPACSQTSTQVQTYGCIYKTKAEVEGTLCLRCEKHLERIKEKEKKSEKKYKKEMGC